MDNITVKIFKQIYDTAQPEDKVELLKSIVPVRVVYSYTSGDRSYGTTIYFYETDDTPENNLKVLELIYEHLINDEHLCDTGIEALDNSDDMEESQFKRTAIKLLSKDITILNKSDEQLESQEMYFCLLKTPATEWSSHFKFTRGVEGEPIHLEFKKI